MKSRQSGFTLVELLTVMGIMALLMSISAIGFIGMRRGAELRGAVMSVRTTLMLARQQAVTKRQYVDVQFFASGQDSGILVTQGNPPVTNSIVYLPRGIEYASLPAAIQFKPSGGAGGTGTSTVGIREKAGTSNAKPQSKTITVWLLSGVTEES